MSNFGPKWYNSTCSKNEIVKFRRQHNSSKKSDNLEPKIDLRKEYDKHYVQAFEPRP